MVALDLFEGPVERVIGRLRRIGGRLFRPILESLDASLEASSTAVFYNRMRPWRLQVLYFYSRMRP